MNLSRFASILLALASGAVMAIDLDTLWDFSRPAESEQRLRAALEKSSGDDAFILRTQIARTYGLRKDFDEARRLLRELEPSLGAVGAEARTHYHLELGRTFASAAHPPDLLTPDAKRRARQAFDRAEAQARASGLDALAIDAIHMQAFVDPAPADRLRWGEAALEIALSSRQPQARRWEASMRNNVGYALHQLGRYDEALRQFQQALAIRERETNAQATRVARWMVAWTLRSLGRNDEALQIQLALEKDTDAAGEPDPYVFEELEALYRARGDLARAEHYAERRSAAGRK